MLHALIRLLRFAWRDLVEGQTYHCPECGTERSCDDCLWQKMV